MAETVVNLVCSQLNDNILYRLDRASVNSDSWTVVPPPVGLQVLLVNSQNEVVDKKIFEKDLTREWEGEEFGWRYDLDWFYDKYQEIVEVRSLIEKSTTVWRSQGKDDQTQHEVPDYLVDAILKTYFEMESKESMWIYNFNLKFDQFFKKLKKVL